MELKPLPIGIQEFEKIVTEGRLYVDKTEYIYRLITGGVVYFLSRPRRFGKSLLVSTLEAIFQGQRDLFRGLWIHGSDYDWRPYPVIRMDLSVIQADTAAGVKQALKRYVGVIARQHAVTLAEGEYNEQFADLIRALAERGPVVVLVDEYDKPIIDHLDDIEEAKRIRKVLQGFYTILKGMDEYLRFVFLTGVSKFSKVGVFSGLNHLHDITMDNRYSALLGITGAEMRAAFAGYIERLAAAEGSSRAAVLEKIAYWYDGFCFSRRCVSVYNPFSLLLLFDTLEFRSHWFETATPTFLINLIKQRRYDVRNLEHLTVDDLAFSSYDLENLRIIPLLFQAGYLTIKKYEQVSDTEGLYRLYYPNYEVERSFLRCLLGSFGPVEEGEAGGYVWELVTALKEADWPRFFDILKVFFAGIPYDIQIPRERYYQTIFYLLFKLIGLHVETEVRTNRGRIDAVVETGRGVYIFEFKMGGEAAAALEQIRERGYAERYLSTGKPVYHVGVSFSLEGRGIVDWQVEPHAPATQDRNQGGTQ